LDIKMTWGAHLLRAASVVRETNETKVSLEINLDGHGHVDVTTGIGFLDHMLVLMASHGLMDLRISASGDLHVDEHHTAEDVMICLGRAIDQALGKRHGIVRTFHSYVPMDEALVLAVIDLGGRPYCVFEADFVDPKVGALSTDLIFHLFESVAIHGRMNLHAHVLYGRNDHHKVEGLFKALGRALSGAWELDERRSGVPSTKGTLTD
jgi:imidazoleglycerol-phosphate dehydratase